MSSLKQERCLSVFEGLKSFSRTDVELSNLFADVFRTDADWRLWLQEGLGELLETPGERVISVLRTNQLQPSDTQTLNFRKDRISIGREPDSDIVVPLVGVGRRHAQITTGNGRCFLEDLGSANGTFLNDVKLEPRKPSLLSEGAHFTIFPYQFSFSNLQTWRPQEPIQVASGVPQVVTWNERRWHDLNAARLFAIKVSPALGSAILQVSEDLFRTLVQRISHVEPEALVPSDTGVLEFLLLSVLARANGNLQFPFYFSLESLEHPKKDQRGVSIECVLDLYGARGLIELFLPDGLLAALRRGRGESALSRLPVSWPLLLTIGYSALSLEELADLEAGDVVLFTSGHRLLLPSTAYGTDRGWDAVLESDPTKLRIEGYFEGSVLTMESETAGSEQRDSQKPHFATLPVRVQIVLCQLELSLAELNDMKPGTIIDLNKDKPECVQLAVNGKIAGSGELVEIEGRLGVRVSNWNSQ